MRNSKEKKSCLHKGYLQHCQTAKGTDMSVNNNIYICYCRLYYQYFYVYFVLVLYIYISIFVELSPHQLISSLNIIKSIVPYS